MAEVRSTRERSRSPSASTSARRRSRRSWSIPSTKEILWSDYQRHQTKQAELVLGFLVRIADGVPQRQHEPTSASSSPARAARPIGPHLGAKFVQEVNAVTLAVETLHPDVGSVVRARRAGRQDHHLQEERGDRATRPPSPR